MLAWLWRGIADIELDHVGYRNMYERKYDSTFFSCGEAQSGMEISYALVDDEHRNFLSSGSPRLLANLQHAIAVSPSHIKTYV